MTTKPDSYHLISLIHCMRKIIEKMVNKWLMWNLESEKLLSPYQARFRNKRSTMDPMTLFESHIQNAFLNREHAIAVFFDLPKAYVQLLPLIQKKKWLARIVVEKQMNSI